MRKSMSPTSLGLLAASAGIIGALLGVFGAQLSTSRNINQEERTRIAVLRSKAYGDHVTAMNTLIRDLTTYAEALDRGDTDVVVDGPLSCELVQKFEPRGLWSNANVTKDLDNLSATFGQVRLLGSEEVQFHSGLLNNKIDNVRVSFSSMLSQRLLAMISEPTKSLDKGASVTGLRELTANAERLERSMASDLGTGRFRPPYYTRPSKNGGRWVVASDVRFTPGGTLVAACDAFNFRQSTSNPLN